MNAVTPLMPHIDFAHDEVPNLHELIEELRPHGPVVPVKYHGAPVWLLLDHQVVKEAFDDYVHFDATQGYKLISEPGQGKTLQTMSGEEHRINRALVNPSRLKTRFASGQPRERGKSAFLLPGSKYCLFAKA